MAGKKVRSLGRRLRVEQISQLPKIGDPNIDPQYTYTKVSIMGTPEKLPLILGNPRKPPFMGEACYDVSKA